MASLVVDHQAHWYSRSYLESILGREHAPYTRKGQDDTYVYIDAVGGEQVFLPSFYTLELQLADMDAHGIDVSVISPNVIGEVSRLPAAEAVETLDFLNAESARAQREHPERFVGLAMLPMQDPDAALEMLDRAIREQGLAGVCLLSNVAGRSIGDRRFLPVYRRIEALDVPLFLHPSHLSVVDGLGYGETIELGLGWMFESAAAALSLVYAGVLDECPDLVVVHPHFGGTLPVVVDRVVEHELGAQKRHDLRTYLQRNFFVDSVQKTPAAATAAVDTYGIDRIVFGTDYPWIDREGCRAANERALPPEQFDRMLANVVPNLRLPVATTQDRRS